MKMLLRRRMCDKCKSINLEVWCDQGETIIVKCGKCGSIQGQWDKWHG